jgi:hypothetical protein
VYREMPHEDASGDPGLIFVAAVRRAEIRRTDSDSRARIISVQPVSHHDQVSFRWSVAINCSPNYWPIL